ncbi:hypothetical protein CBM2626_B30053 [Cupriavidus taiwanensis]|nr:hypothetical protein CBM2626_B30053 [Cupriavidus taiwanensis]
MVTCPLRNWRGCARLARPRAGTLYLRRRSRLVTKGKVPGMQGKAESCTGPDDSIVAKDMQPSIADDAS